MRGVPARRPMASAGPFGRTRPRDRRRTGSHQEGPPYRLGGDWRAQLHPAATTKKVPPPGGGAGRCCDRRGCLDRSPRLLPDDRRRPEARLPMTVASSPVPALKARPTSWAIVPWAECVVSTPGHQDEAGLSIAAAGNISLGGGMSSFAILRDGLSISVRAAALSMCSTAHIAAWVRF